MSKNKGMMNAERKTFRKVFKDDMPAQWVVPVYQRKYVWESGEDKQIQGLWEDWLTKTEELLNEKPLNEDSDESKIHLHYFGAVIYYLQDWEQGESAQKRDLVDGQQRLTTFQLALVALRDTGMKLGYSNAVKINNYVYNKSADVNNDTVLLPSRNDSNIFKEILAIEKNEKILKDKSAITKAYKCFCEKIEEFVEKNKSEEKTVEFLIEKLKDALLDKFQVILIKLGNLDDPQQIFASLNGKGEPLTPFDLIRNDIFYRVSGKKRDVDSEFLKAWEDNFEIKFWRGKVARGRFPKTHADHFIVDVVVAETAKEVKQNKIFTDYKNHVEEHFTSASDELNTLINYGKTYKAMIEKASGAATDRIAKMLKLWDSTTMNPLVMWIDTRPNLSFEEKQNMFLLIESYIIRRYICKSGTRAFNKIAPEILQKMHEAEESGQSIMGAFKKYLKAQTTVTRKIPADQEVINSLRDNGIYKKADSRKLVYIFEEIEKYLLNKRNERVHIDSKVNIEHIMPQKWAKHWPLKDGNKVLHEEYWQAREKGQQLSDGAEKLMDERQSLIDTIGNLTLLSPPLNSFVGNDDWETKKKQLDENSLLKINKKIAKFDEWNEDKIKDRSKELAEYINEIWQHPINH